MAEVAAEAGVSRQAVYLHFGSRSGLLVSLVRAMDDEAGIRNRLESALGEEDPIKAFRRFVREWLRFAIAIQPIASTLYAARMEDEAAEAAWEDRARDLRAGFRAAISRLGEAGYLRDGLSLPSAANLVWAFCSLPVVEQLLLDLEWSSDRIVREVPEAALEAVTS